MSMCHVLDVLNQKGQTQGTDPLRGFYLPKGLDPKLMDGVSTKSYVPHFFNRIERQYNRTFAGIDSNALAGWERKALFRQQERLLGLFNSFMSDGELDAGEKRRLTRRQNIISRNIYGLKHNQYTA